MCVHPCKTTTSRGNPFPNGSIALLLWCFLIFAEIVLSGSPILEMCVLAEPFVEIGVHIRWIFARGSNRQVVHLS